jgi:hypothetical protein
MVVCHCKNCKKWSGSAFAANIRFPANSLTIDPNSTIKKLVDDKTLSGRALERHFCTGCGSSMYLTIPRMPEVVSVMSGVLDGPVEWADAVGDDKVDEATRLQGLSPGMEYFGHEKCAWVNLGIEVKQ